MKLIVAICAAFCLLGAANMASAQRGYGGVSVNAPGFGFNARVGGGGYYGGGYRNHNNYNRGGYCRPRYRDYGYSYNNRPSPWGHRRHRDYYGGYYARPYGGGGYYNRGCR